MDSLELANRITDLIFNKKGYDVRILDLRNLAAFADYFVICSADSDTQVQAISDEVDKSLRNEGIKSWHKEGTKAYNWVLIDYVDVVVHVFKKDAREFYSLERLWGDAPVIIAEDPVEKAAREKAAKNSAETESAPAPKSRGRKKTAKSDNAEDKETETSAPDDADSSWEEQDITEVKKGPVKRGAKKISKDADPQQENEEEKAPAKKRGGTARKQAGKK